MAKNIFLTLIFLPLLLVFLVLTSVKFQILDPDFLPRVLEEGNVYPKLEEVIEKGIEVQTLAEGGTKSEAKLISKTINPDSLKDFLGKNLKNLGNFANGVGDELKVYIPVKLIPKGVFPKDLKLTEEMNFSQLSNLKINWVKNIGFVVTVLWFILLILLVFLVVSSFWMTPIVGAIFTFLVIGVGNMAKSGLGQAQSLFGTIGPPVLSKAFELWVYFAVGLVVIGIIKFVVNEKLKTKIRN